MTRRFIYNVPPFTENIQATKVHWERLASVNNLTPILSLLTLTRDLERNGSRRKTSWKDEGNLEELKGNKSGQKKMGKTQIGYVYL